MIQNNSLSASIVLFHNKEIQIKKAINSFLNTSLKVKLYLIDNSANNNLQSLADIDNRIEYVYNNANLGYGTAHNIAITKSINSHIPYHLVLNPDIIFDDNVLVDLFEYMEQHQNIGNIMPQILYPNGDIQHLAKLLPSPMDLIFRRFIPLKKWREKHNNKFELKFYGYKDIANIPNLSGCFMFLRTRVLQKVGIFDENIFMYLEDIDLNRRINNEFDTIFYPKIAITHEYEKGSYKNSKLLVYHIKSAIYYFNKWGWIFDKQRKQVNKKTLIKLGYKKGKK
jgi:GT2 family glycosyltransferase